MLQRVHYHLLKKLAILVLVALAGLAGTAEAKIGKPSKALKSVIKQHNAMNMSGNITQAAFDKVANQYKTLLKQSPNEKALIYINMGRLYRGVANPALRNFPTAVSYLQEALTLMDDEDNFYRGLALNDIGICYMRPSTMHNMEVARRNFLQASRYDRKYTVSLARMSLFGWGVPMDYFLALCFYDIATRAGWDGGMENYSYMVNVLNQDERGELDTLAMRGLEKAYFYWQVSDQPQRALSSMTMSAEMGLLTAQFEMGLMLRTGDNYMNTNVDDDDEAWRWFRRSADQGYAPGVTELARLCWLHTMDTAQGNIFEKGANGKYSSRAYDQVFKECTKMLMRVATAGYPPAEQLLGQMYMKGEPHGTIKHDYKKAYYWLLLAKSNGLHAADDDLKELDRITDQSGEQVSAEEYKRISLEVKQNKSRLDISAVCMNRVIRGSRWSHPRWDRSSYYTMRIEGKKMPMPKASDLNVKLASTYKEAYNLFIDLLKDMSRHTLPYSDAERKHYQQMMAQIRSRAEFLTPVSTIQASPWENWDGK